MKSLHEPKQTTTIFISDIKWETDEKDINLPTEETFENLRAEDAADALSDKHGFLVKSFSTTYETILPITKSFADYTDQCLKGERKCNSETALMTAKFPDGCEMDIKLCDAPAEEGGPWAEAVLFNENGCEVACTDVSDEFIGKWELTYNDDTYVANIVVKV